MTSEYAHCMGNALGNFSEYWDEINHNTRLMGGFIWDWVDQGIIRDGKVLYGGDFGDKPNLHAFCMNGVIMSDRTLTPKYYEVQAVYGKAAQLAGDSFVPVNMTKVDDKVQGHITHQPSPITHQPSPI
jgi:beta-galactosidase